MPKFFMPLVNKFAMPENGIVQPEVEPPMYRPKRRTNQLEYFGEVINEIVKNRFSIFFRNPVNSIESNIPDYHNIIQYPMDLNTIKLRFENSYYLCVQDGINDFNLMLDNCFLFNEPNDRPYTNGMRVKKLFNSRMELMPTPEIELLECDENNTEINEQENTNINEQENTNINEQENTNINEQENTNINEQENTNINEQENININEQENTNINDEINIPKEDEDPIYDPPEPMEQQPIATQVIEESVSLPMEYSDIPEILDMTLDPCTTDEFQSKIDTTLDSDEISIQFQYENPPLESVEIPTVIENNEQAPNSFCDPIFGETVVTVVNRLISIRNEMNALAYSLEEQAALEQTASEQAASEQAASEQAAFQQAAFEQAAFQQAAFEQATVYKAETNAPMPDEAVAIAAMPDDAGAYEAEGEESEQSDQSDQSDEDDEDTSESDEDTSESDEDTSESDTDTDEEEYCNNTLTNLTLNS